MSHFKRKIKGKGSHFGRQNISKKERKMLQGHTAKKERKEGKEKKRKGREEKMEEGEDDGV